MKKVYVIKLSDDGIDPIVYTNIKAVYHAIKASDDSNCYIPKFIGYTNLDPAFNYANLLAELKNTNYGCHIECSGGSYIEIFVCKLKTKYSKK